MIRSVVTDRITLFDGNGALSADFPYNAGLARAVRASLILDAVKKAERNFRSKVCLGSSSRPR